MIITILPLREGFSEKHFGAISLCVFDFLTHSKYISDICVLGGIKTSNPLMSQYHYVKGINIFPISRTAAYINKCIKTLKSKEFSKRYPAFSSQTSVIEIHNRPQYVRMLYRQTNLPITLHLHNDPQAMKYGKSTTERELLAKHCAAIYCVSNYIKHRFIEDLDYKYHEKVFTVYSGLNTNFFSPSDLNKKKKQIIFVGKLIKEKGYDLFAEAIEEILNKYNQWQVMIIGDSGNKRELAIRINNIRNLQKRFGSRLMYLEKASHQEVMYNFAISSIAVVPSRWHEPFGRTALEALATGCALISSGRGGLYEITGPDAAITLDKLDSNELSCEIARLIERPDLIRSFQYNALERAKHFEISKVSRRLDELRDNILLK